MSEHQRWVTDLVKFHGNAKETVGEFLYKPFGIESTDGLNAITLYVFAAVAVFVLFRLFTPARRARAHSKPDHYDFGRGL
ncbi:hypothetical protein GE300_09065 [Rhodobacteraceae bacterium 2CG4]|uniref:Uncharacterized protein n=1 Tax=Halovulum marinum TaxID=2662447 RepID=A0A6L5YZM3_9RHOB|nr:hypothetical protein [Halovulum marinum]MSU89766.1 hypothetical protein [Halovulum marinum]